jgi:hypothetical protein
MYLGHARFGYLFWLSDPEAGRNAEGKSLSVRFFPFREQNPSWTFWSYGLVSIAAWIFVQRLVPETKGRSLEQIEQEMHGKPA